MRSRKTTFAIVLCLLALILPTRADEPSREYQIKAAFIYNFVQFVEWPAGVFENDSSPIVIGVLGPNPFGDALEHAVQGKNVNGRSLAIHYFSRIDDIDPCQVLFVNSNDPNYLAMAIERVKEMHVLTIGESDQFPWVGGVIRFYSEDNRVRFEINTEAADKAQLKISSKLLKLARIFQK